MSMTGPEPESATLGEVEKAAEAVEAMVPVMLDWFRTKPVAPLRDLLAAWDKALADTEAFLLADNDRLAFDAQVLGGFGLGLHALGEIEQSAARMRQAYAKAREGWREAQAILAERERGEP